MVVVPVLSVVVALGVMVAGTRAATADDLASARASANKAAAAMSDAESTLGRLSGQINQLEAQQASAKARIDALRGVVHQIAVHRYINADAARLASLDPDINAQAEATALSRYALQGNQDAIDQFSAAADDLRLASKGLQAKNALQKDAVATLAKREAAVTAQLSKLEQLESQRQTAAVRSATLAKAAPGATQAAPGATQAAPGAAKAAPGATRAAPTGPIVTGAWVCPVQGPVAFTDSFGAPRAGGRRHEGVDMMSPRGTPTVAPVSGTLQDHPNALGGNAWYVYGDDGNTYYGAHLDSYANGNAGHVQAGTVIGYVGNTGDASGGATHLHFEIHPHGGAAVDPYPTVKQYC